MSNLNKRDCVLPAHKGNRKLDCYEFYLWTMGEIEPPDGMEENVWDYVEGKEKGSDVHGYQVF